MRIPIARVCFSDDEINAVIDVLKSGMLRQGKKVEEFERIFAEEVGARYAVATSSGSSALHIAYMGSLDKGCEVLVPAFTHISTASMLCLSGMKPVFCDIDPKTFTIDLDDLSEKITKKTKAIAPVHLFGNACEIDEILEIAQDYRLKVIWDAAQAHGTEYKGKDVGGFNDAVCYSFYPTKNITTGEGGMITTNSEELNKRYRLLREHGQERKYFHTVLGFNYRMTDVEAAVGIVQVKKLNNFIEKRRKNAELLTKHLSKIRGIGTPYVKDYVKHSYHQYSILVNPDEAGVTRDGLLEKLRLEGIGVAVHYPIPLHLQPVFRKLLGTKEGDLPVCEEISTKIMSLPIHPYLTEEDIKAVATKIGEIVEGGQ